MKRVEFIRETVSDRSAVISDSPVCIVSLCPGDPQAELSSALRSSLVRSFRTPVSRASRRRAVERSLPPPSGDLRVDTLLIRSPLTVPALPGLDGNVPSRVRDCAAMLLESLPAVWVVFVTGLEEPTPSDPDMLNQLRIALDSLPGRLVLFPDLDRPNPLPMSTVVSGRETYRDHIRTRFARWEARVMGLGPLLRELFLTGLVDLPAPNTAELLDLNLTDTPRADLAADLRAFEGFWALCAEDSVSRLAGMDLSLCCWRGPWHALSRHGWRSSATLAARVLGAYTGSSAMAQLERRQVPLGGGRTVNHSRLTRLLPTLEEGFELEPSLARHVVAARVNPQTNTCMFEGQASLRAPIGFWTLPAVRSLKEIELTLRRVAERFVFQPVNQTSALELMNALQYGLDDHLISGVLSALSTGEPLISARPDRSETPGLVAHVVATLRPWSHVLRFRLSVRSEGIALEVS